MAETKARVIFKRKKTEMFQLYGLPLEKQTLVRYLLLLGSCIREQIKSRELRDTRAIAREVECFTTTLTDLVCPKKATGSLHIVRRIFSPRFPLKFSVFQRFFHMLQYLGQ